MRSISALLHFAFLAVVSCAALPESPASQGLLPAGFATTNGTRFTIDGRADYLVGTNAYWLSFRTNDADIDLALDQLVASGVRVLRIWGFNDVTAIPTDPSVVWFQYLSKSGSIINTGPNGLQRLDYVVAAAEKRDLKLIIPFVNNWQDYGGIPAYTSAFGNGGSTWFKHAPSQAQYQAYIKAVVSRYAASPAIFSWQLANEPRCQFCSTDDIFNWATKTSEYIKSLDPHHMVSTGEEGQGLTGDVWTPYWLVFGTDFVRNLKIKTIDFGTFHMYPTTCKLYSTLQSFISLVLIKSPPSKGVCH
jgi:mannan endo-1,4-beta-mannosidase